MKPCVPSFVKGSATFAVHLFPVVSWKTFLLASLRFTKGRRLEITSSRQIWRYLNNICPSLPALTPISSPESKKCNEKWKLTSQYSCNRQDMTASETRRDKIYILNVRTEIFIRKPWAVSWKYLSNYLPSRPKCRPRIFQTWCIQLWCKVNSLLRSHFASYIYVYVYIYIYFIIFVQQIHLYINNICLLKHSWTNTIKFYKMHGAYIKMSVCVYIYIHTYTYLYQYIYI
jgi:hypothetical protein